MPTKRLHTYRLCTFEAQRRAVPFQFPLVHPFKPLRALRLLGEVNADPAITRRVFDHIWREGNDPNDDGSWSRLLAELDLDASDPLATPLDMRANTQDAIDAGVFGVPTLAIGGEIFWGVDALPMTRAFIADPALFEAGEMERSSVIENPLLSPARGAPVGCKASSPSGMCQLPADRDRKLTVAFPPRPVSGVGGSGRSEAVHRLQSRPVDLIFARIAAAA